MQKRNTQQRRRAIIERLNQRGEVAVEELSKVFNTSEVTIRKDLAELESNGLLLRKFGGAVLLPTESSELSTANLSNRKKAIASLAATLIRDHNRIIVDSGSTTSALIPHLPSKLGLVVMTNSLHVANSLLELENEPQVLMTGGTWDQQSHSFQGQMAEQMLRAYNFDQAFLGAAGLDTQRGSTTFNELTSLSRTMAEVTKQVIVLAESEKLERKIPNVELPWSQISVLVTDDGIDNDAKQQIEQHGVTVLCANVM
ncbi:DeoR/GlpR family DNA-binding transcription regulator [Aliiglaciecola sp. M165]|uniref:DeoR/GlpR family DNA-binding transcription regulator n=1 Tax=Aliiglaciecola sp. M165 TaxID=2593649 RepID=UPI00117E9804|nr:DeoR/GlpR family DNA-binding transcription regulator [Aliiglaciecola sp. M165]TRY33170.1 DeoR/GlpR transcriptional regulator [Aliiglaciecola sp. M165]